MHRSVSNRRAWPGASPRGSAAAWEATRPIVLAALVTATVGCSASDRLATYPVTGKVALPDGTPLAGGTIIFESIDNQINARGVIGLDGSFTLGTYEKGDGAAEGLHRVAVLPDPPMNVDPDEQEAPQVIHPRYADLDQSGLEFSVRAQGANEFYIQVDRP